MSATVHIEQYTGPAPGTATDKTGGTVRFCTDDTARSTGDESYPLIIPGPTYSYWASFRLNATVAPVTSINNLKFYTDGVNSSPSGVTWKGQAANVGANNGYRQATGTPSTTGDLLNTTNHTGLTGAPVDIFTFTAGSPKALAGSIGAATGAFGDFMVIQCQVDATVVATAALTGETLYWATDEV